MELYPWFIDHWFELLETVLVTGSLCFDAIEHRVAARAKNVDNLLTITSNHRNIWREYSSRPELQRILNNTADIKDAPITIAEEEFVNFVILHLNSVHHAMKSGMVKEFHGLPRDIRGFLALPIPGLVWDRIKTYQNIDFVQFVDDCKKADF